MYNLDTLKPKLCYFYLPYVFSTAKVGEPLCSCLLFDEQMPLKTVSVSFTSYSQRVGERKISQFKWEQSRGDYLASNRVLAPTLRLKPFSITDISADVAPASPDPLELPASWPLRVCRFSASMLGHSVRPPDQWRVTRDLGMAPVQTHRQPQSTQALASAIRSLPLSG